MEWYCSIGAMLRYLGSQKAVLDNRLDKDGKYSMEVLTILFRFVEIGSSCC